MKRWKGAITKCLVFFLLGAVVNVAVAWACVAGGSGLVRQGALSPPFTWPRRVPERWPAPRESLRAASFGYRLHDTKGSAQLAYDGSRRVITPEDIRSGWFQEQETERGFELYMLDLYVAGWPCGALRSEIWKESIWVREEGAPYDITRRHDGHPPQTVQIRGAAYPESWPGYDGNWKRIPLRPVWSGFAVNTLFYAVVLWLLIPGPFKLRRSIRRKRGRCIKCGYDLRSDPDAGCPECGWNRISEDDRDGYDQI